MPRHTPLALTTLAALLASSAFAVPPAPRLPPAPALPVGQATFEYGEADHTLPYEVVDGWIVVGGDMFLAPVGDPRVATTPWGQEAAPERLHMASNPIRFWPGAVIPYVLSEDYLQMHSRRQWQQAVDHIHQRTDLRLVERTDQRHFVEVTATRNDGCNAVLGYMGRGAQTINLARDCGSRGTHVHEILHAFGRPHEHQRHDRDTFLEVRWSNIKPEKQLHFRKMNHHRYMPPSSTYDYESVMHYKPRAFSVNGGRTLIARTPPAPPGQQVGRNNGLTPTDVSVVNFLVGVARRGLTGPYWSENPFGPEHPLDGPFGLY